MKTLDPSLDMERFWRRLETAPRRVLLLDYDGTLAPFRQERDRAVPYAGVREALRPFLEEVHTRLVVVSGRAVEHLLPLLDMEPAPEIHGSHGWEHRASGGPTRLRDLPEGAGTALEEARETAEESGADPARIEEKPASLAFHDRGLPASRKDPAARLREAWEEVAERSPLRLHPFDGGFELRIPGRDKGSAVRDILAEEPEDAVVAYLGDDLTDEDAFHELDARDPERTLTALVRTETRETRARLWLRPPGELMGFLHEWRRRALVRAGSQGRLAP